MRKVTPAILFLAACIPITCCKDQRRHQVGGAVDLATVNSPLPANAPPLDVARQMLQAIEEAQKSRSNGMGSATTRQAYSDALARIASITAKADVHKNLKQA